MNRYDAGYYNDNYYEPEDDDEYNEEIDGLDYEEDEEEDIEDE